MRWYSLSKKPKWGAHILFREKRVLNDDGYFIVRFETSRYNVCWKLLCEVNEFATHWAYITGPKRIMLEWK